MCEELNMQVWTPVLREVAGSGTRAEAIGESGRAIMRAHLSDDVIRRRMKVREPAVMQQNLAELRAGGTPRIKTFKGEQEKRSPSR